MNLRIISGVVVTTKLRQNGKGEEGACYRLWIEVVGWWGGYYGRVGGGGRNSAS